MALYENAKNTLERGPGGGENDQMTEAQCSSAIMNSYISTLSDMSNKCASKAADGDNVDFASLKLSGVPKAPHGPPGGCDCKQVIEAIFGGIGEECGEDADCIEDTTTTPATAHTKKCCDEFKNSVKRWCKDYNEEPVTNIINALKASTVESAKCYDNDCYNTVGNLLSSATTSAPQLLFTAVLALLATSLTRN
eukprot:CAMPEP_0184298862 /NCGR_PEP_ID=MMETSP1049-20130417/9584_1 /TAXON_ID=77928 /ORGANISM="Proteomonas sulcata, Strain CCMP704" /LENGTH=193 /DNA_ID=CAMNT_0026609121 /DNA_START=166 /DNA_END=747 /DNA_ORIENTATION=+